MTERTELQAAKNIDEGGPAFPMLEATGSGLDLQFRGMTLRDHFAGLAMQALIEKTELLIQVTLEDGSHHGSSDEFMKKHREGITRNAYVYADEMIQARKS